MFAILKKELNLFFASPIGYLVIAIFLLINGLFLWIFKGDFNILNAGFADLNSFFFITPWFFIFLIPAITMRSFSDEIRLGTIEIIKTKPITNWQIVFGKFLGSFILIILALVPTLSYVYTVIQLGNPLGNLDFGSTLGSYLGLLLLASSFTAIGLFTSTLSNNQIVAFITGVALSLFMFYGFEAIADLITNNNNYIIENFGMTTHFKSISRGVIDTRDILYFISLTFFFLFLTKIKFEYK
jgi:gliding motility-associated transport system permease protein